MSFIEWIIFHTCGHPCYTTFISTYLSKGSIEIKTHCQSYVFVGSLAICWYAKQTVTSNILYPNGPC